ncbi:hypothetical protein BRD17_01915 [Halobacteriales archaeon SW_7_68_16]|nr:MAG: hypothetical protein BRD17_01915 [Halobacteriales archaeon SW_7_68_16]
MVRPEGRQPRPHPALSPAGHEPNPRRLTRRAARDIYLPSPSKDVSDESVDSIVEGSTEASPRGPEDEPVDSFLEVSLGLSASSLPETSDRARQAYEAIGRPLAGTTVVHVLGTNGKGSTAGFLADALAADDVDAGIFSEPHVAGSDRLSGIRVDGDPIPAPAYRRIAREIADAAPVEPSIREVETLVAAAYLDECNVDVAVIEAVISSGADVTAALDTDLVAVTTVGVDHTDVLGDTRDAVAAAMADAIPSGGTVVSGGGGEPGRVIRAAAVERDASFVHPLAPVTGVTAGDGLGLRITYRDHEIASGAVGHYQVGNVRVGATAAERLGVTEGAIVEAIRAFGRPGRMETVAAAPRTVVDGAHNPHAFRALAATVAPIDAPVTAVVGVLDKKNWAEMATIVPEFADDVIVTAPSGANPHDDAPAPPEAVAAAIPAPTAVVRDPVAATRRARGRTPDDGLVLVVGSFYVVAPVRAAFIDGGA